MAKQWMIMAGIMQLHALISFVLLLPCLGMMDCSSTTIHLIHNALASFVLDQLDEFSSKIIMGYFNSKLNRIAKKRNFLRFKSDSKIEAPLNCQYIFMTVIAIFLVMMPFIFETNFCRSCKVIQYLLIGDSVQTAVDKSRTYIEQEGFSRLKLIIVIAMVYVFITFLNMACSRYISREEGTCLKCCFCGQKCQEKHD